MKNMRVITLACSSAVLSAALSLPGYAAQPADPDASQHMSSSDSRDMESQAKDALLEGKLDTIYLFNRQLNNFTIDPEIRGSSVVLTGKVESEVDKELAEQIALGMDGITQVSNRLMVVPGDEARAGMAEREERTFYDKVEDSTVTAEVKTKLLANDETSGLSIHVDTVARTVTLTGDVESDAEKQLAEQIASHVEGVQAVNNQLQIKS